MLPNNVRVRPITDSDRPTLARLLGDQWATTTVVVHETVFRPAALPGIVALHNNQLHDNQLSGVLTYDIDGDALEIVTVDVLRSGDDVAAVLLDAAIEEASRRGLSRVAVTITNDNLEALRFYQRKGFHLTALRIDVVRQTRRLKPQTPEIGKHDIPLRDELDLERLIVHTD